MGQLPQLGVGAGQFLGRSCQCFFRPPALGYLDEQLRNPEFISYLTAISAGAVFMGANTYIGNAPNFMVKSIAEEAGIPMPSFFGYMIKYSIPILIPAFVIVTLIFFL